VQRYATEMSTLDTEVLQAQMSEGGYAQDMVSLQVFWCDYQ